LASCKRALDYIRQLAVAGDRSLIPLISGIQEKQAQAPVAAAPAAPQGGTPAPFVPSAGAEIVDRQIDGDGEEDFQQGESLYDQKRYGEALPHLQAAAQQGHPRAQFRLGWMYGQGEGVEKDEAQSAYWYEKAAQQGHTTAQFNLGVMNENGEGIPQNWERALYWYQKAAQQDYPRAYFCVGWIYEHGKNGPQNQAEALTWYRKGAEVGDDASLNALGIFYENGYVVERDPAAALRWYQQSAEKGNK
jgi:hypothetical protein